MADGSYFTGLRRIWLAIVLLYCSEAMISFAQASSKQNGTSYEHGMNCSTVNTSSTSIVLNWSAENSEHAHTYLVQYWPVYDPDKRINITVGQRSSCPVSQLEVQTRYQFIVMTTDGNGQTWTRVCSVFAKTGRQTLLPELGLRQFIINTTTAYVYWKRGRIEGMHVSYRVFMEWGSEMEPKSALVYQGNRTNTVVKGKPLPKPIHFHVNAVYKPIETNTTTTTAAPATRKTTVTRPANLTLNVKVAIYGWNFIHLEWDPVPALCDNVTYRVESKTSAHARQVMTSQDDIVLGGLQQFTTYLIRVRAQINDDVIVTSEWVSVRTSDQDECSTGHHACHEKATCINTRGSYSCICHDGLVGDGFVCNVSDVLADIGFCHAHFENDILWPGTVAGQKQAELCPEGTTGVASRRCLETSSSPEWDVPDMSQCVTNAIANIHQQLEGTNVDPIPVANKLVRFTSDPAGRERSMYSGDVRLIVSSLGILSRDSMKRVLGETSSSGNYNKAKKLSEAVLTSSSNILDSKARSSWNYMPKELAEKEASNLIDSLDAMAAQLAMAANTSKPIVAKTPNVVLSVRSMPSRARDITDQRLPPNEDMRDDIPSSVTIPASVIKAQAPGKDQKRYLTLVSYKSMKDLLQLQEPGSPRGHINSAIVSVKMTPLETNRFDEPVVITIKRSQDDALGKPTCVFLNVTKRKRLSWSGEGCEVSSTNASHTVCHCYHLTSFAILMDVTKAHGQQIQVEHQFALSLITYIGIGLSLVALIVVFLTFTFMRFLRSPRHFIHANLAISLALAETVFLFGVNRTEYQLLCKILAISMHYLFLVAFSWMALEGVILYMMLVKVFRSSVSGRKTKTIFFSCGWGLPAIVVIISSAVYHEGYGTEMFCWLSLERQFIWAFVAPVLAVIGFNFICLGRTFLVMARRGNNGNKETKIDKIRYWTRSCCLLTCILGVTWLLGIFFVNRGTLVMAYLFNILNALQGLLIFLLHCIGDHKIRAAYHRLLQCNTDPLSSTSGGRLVSSRSTRDQASEDRRRSKSRRVEKRPTMTSLIKSPYVTREEAKETVPLAPNKQAYITPNSQVPVRDEDTVSTEQVKQQQEVEVHNTSGSNESSITLLQDDAKLREAHWV